VGRIQEVAIMNQETTQFKALQKDRVLAQKSRTPQRVRCHVGTLWVTQDGDPRDVILEAGQQFVTDRTGELLISALVPSLLTVEGLGPDRGGGQRAVPSHPSRAREADRIGA